MIPCKDCLTLAICKHRFSKYNELGLKEPIGVINLTNKCSILNDFIFDGKYPFDISEHKKLKITNVTNFFIRQRKSKENDI